MLIAHYHNKYLPTSLGQKKEIGIKHQSFFLLFCDIQSWLSLDLGCSLSHYHKKYLPTFWGQLNDKNQSYSSLQPI